MIILKTLTWSNCFSYGAENSIELNENLITQLVGVNGAGKSSIPLIVEEVLFNKNSKGVKKADIPNRRLDGPYSMGLKLEVDEDNYEIQLTRKASLKVKLLKNGEDISSHTATNTFKTIESILGVDFKTFSQLVYQNTSNSLHFLTATDTNRKKFLISLLNLERYVEYFEVFKQLTNSFANKTIELKSSINTIEKWLQENNLEGMKVLTPLKIDINLENDEKQLSSLLMEFENISEINRKISKNNNYRERLNAINLTNPGVTKQPTESLITSIANYNTELLGIKKELEKMKNLGFECHTCGQKITRAFKESIIDGCEADIGILEPRISELNEKLKKVKIDNTKVDAYEKAQKEFQSLYSAIDDSLPKEPLDADNLSERITSIRLELDRRRRQLTSLIEKNNQIERNNTKIEIIKEQTDKFKEALDKAEKELNSISDVHANLEILKKAFSTNGLLAYKIEFLIKELEEIVNDYLVELSDGRFTLEFAINNDKLNVVLTDEGHIIEVTSLSSGELARVTTATLLAIRKLMSSISKSRINVLFLDEVIGVLDTEGREKLVDILTKETQLNTYIVSHEWSHPLLARLDVVKEDNISRIENG